MKNNEKHGFCFIINSFSTIVFCSLLLACSDTYDEEKVIPDFNLKSTSDYIVVFGDIQEYTESFLTMKYFNESVFWIKGQYGLGARILDVLQVGDITSTNSKSQWSRFKNASSIITSVLPFFVCTGNHDYSTNMKFQIENRKSTLINEYAHFPLTDSKIKTYYSNTELENYVAELSDRNHTNLIVLEFGARKEVLAWAIEYVQAHSDERFILMTHEWLTRYGERISIASYAESQFSGFSSYSTPEEIWESLVKPNDNIVCVLCGHNGFSAKLFSTNDAGRDVPQILFNLQYQEHGGNGLIQLWEFPEESEDVHICVYDTINKEWYMPDSTSITFRYSY